MRMMAGIIPLTIFPLLIYNAGLMLISGTAAPGVWTVPILSVPLPSGVTWTISTADVLILIAIFALAAEIARTIRVRRRGLAEHAMAAAILMIYLIAFLTVPASGTALFSMLAAVALLDFIFGILFSVGER